MYFPLIFLIIPLCSADFRTEFDLRNHEFCGEVVKKVPIQGSCLTTWALQATSVLEDRICIATMSAIRVEVSPMDLIGCCNKCVESCGDDKGTVQKAFLHWMYHGIRTRLILPDECIPNYNQCDKFNRILLTKPWKPCENKDWEQLPTCPKGCKFNPLPSLLYKGSGLTEIKGSIDLIKKELMTHGPLAFTMPLYSTLVHYPGGVYIPNTNADDLGLHSLKLVGWNQAESNPYWIAMNSWEEEWGHDGAVRIAMRLPDGALTLTSLFAPDVKGFKLN